MNINLPKYNQTVYAELLQAMVWNNKCALCAATVTGKSYIAAKFVQEAVIKQDTLILVPFRASAKIWNTLLPQATTMTYQGLLYNRPELAKYKLIICDEMHHLGADEWGKVFNELMENYHGKLLGLTATPIRFLDGNRNIAKEFFDGNDIQGVQLSEAIQKKILPTFEYVTALYDLPESKGNNELTENLGLAGIRRKYSEEFKDDIKKYYCQKNGIDLILQKYPGYTRAGITNIANRMGLTFRDSQPWTAEEDELLKQNASLSISELLKIFPDRTKAGITGRKHNLGITNRSMHTWTEEEISILKANADLTSEEIRSRFFPDLTISNINSARRKYDCRKDRNWKPEKIERFCALYSKGGWNAVKKDPEFSDMSKKAINGAAHRYNVHSAASHPTTWTEEEKDICREWLAIPEKERPPRRELAKRIPAHSENGIKDMCRRLKTD